MRKVILLMATSLFAFSGCSKEAPEEEKEIKYDYSKAANVFILAGQSNMEGQSLVSNLSSYLEDNNLPKDYYEKGFEDIKISYMGKENSTNKVSPISGEFVGTKLGYGASKLRFGPDVSLAEKLHKTEKNPQNPVYFIKFTYSGAGFMGEPNFKSPSTNETGQLWLDMVAFIHNCLDLVAEDGYLPIIKGLLWAQGENDGWSSKGASLYEEHMLAFLDDFKKEFNDYCYNFDSGNLVFIDSYISKDSIWEYCDSINETKDKISALSEKYFVIDTLSTGLDLKLGDEEHGGGDKCHYTVDSTIRLGYAFADIIIKNKLLDF